MSQQSFAEVLAQVEDGKLVAELDKVLAEVTAGVIDTRKAGSVKLTLKVTPTGKNTVVIAHKVDASVPEERYATTFFVGDRGELQRNDPNQARLDLREPDVPARGPLREVDDTNVRPLREAAKA